MSTEVVSNAVVELRDKYKARFKEMGEILELSGPDRDLSRKSVLEKLGAKDSAEAFEKLTSRNRELEGIQNDLRHEEIKAVAAQQRQREAELNTPSGAIVHPTADNGVVKSMGQLFVESKAYTEGWKKNHQREVPAMVDISVKTLMETGAGFAPRH